MDLLNILLLFDHFKLFNKLDRFSIFLLLLFFFLLLPSSFILPHFQNYLPLI